MSASSYNTVTIDLAALRHNYRHIRGMVPRDVKVMAIVKSNAYGHGLVPVARAFYEAGARTFGVAEVEEGVALRETGLGGDIIVLLGAPPEAFDQLVRHDLSPVIFSGEHLAVLSSVAERARKKVGVHLKVDVGMGRLGVMPLEVGAVIHELNRLPGIFLAGLLSHFALADSDTDKTLTHWRTFEVVRREVETLVPANWLAHIANSAAVMRHRRTYAGMVRPGIALYGHPPGSDDAFRDAALKPAMSFATRVVQVKELPAGVGVSYGHRHITTRATRVAVLPLGYDDGYLRCLTGKAEVLIHGRRAPILGTICMNACMADVTEIADVRPGDGVVVMGWQEGEAVSAEEIAGWMGTINYEVLCLFGSRNNHIYEHGRPTPES